jgi:hypothetical protein
MSIPLKQSTASQEIPLGYFVDESDGVTAEDALSIANTDIKIWKAGATSLADKNSGGATHISGGIYYTVLDATDTNTLGPLVVFVHVAGALPVRAECNVMAANVYDSLVAGSDALQVDVIEMAAGALTASAIASDAITAAKLASDVTTELQSGLATAAALTGVAGDVTSILGDTNELQTDWANGGRLDLILDARASQTTADAIEVDTQDIQGRIPAALVSGRIDSSVGAMAANTLTASALAADAVTEIQSGLSTLTAGQVLTQIDAALDTAGTELSAVPTTTGTLRQKINYVFQYFRNRKTVTSSTETLFKEDASTSLGTATLADDGTTFTKGESN